MHTEGDVLMPAKKMRGIKNPRKYEALRRRGLGKTTAARIANSGGKKRRRKRRR